MHVEVRWFVEVGGIWHTAGAHGCGRCEIQHTASTHGCRMPCGRIHWRGVTEHPACVHLHLLLMGIAVSLLLSYSLSLTHTHTSTHTPHPPLSCLLIHWWGADRKPYAFSRWVIARSKATNDLGHRGEGGDHGV